MENGQVRTRTTGRIAAPSFCRRFRPAVAALLIRQQRRPVSADVLARDAVLCEFAATFAEQFWLARKACIASYVRNIGKDDLYTISLCALVRALGEFDQRRGVDAADYLSLKMFNACLEELRSNYCGDTRATRGLSDPIEVIPFDEDLDATVVEPEADTCERLEVLDAVQRLPEQGRRVLTLYYLEERSDQEIGRIFNPARPLNRSTIMRYRRRAEAQLAALLGVAPKEAPLPGIQALSPAILAALGLFNAKRMRYVSVVAAPNCLTATAPAQPASTPAI